VDYLRSGGGTINMSAGGGTIAVMPAASATLTPSGGTAFIQPHISRDADEFRRYVWVDPLTDQRQRDLKVFAATATAVMALADEAGLDFGTAAVLAVFVGLIAVRERDDPLVRQMGALLARLLRL
jgi:hypothetical protein